MGKTATAPSSIYAIRCTDNGKVYIGRSADVRHRAIAHFAFMEREKASPTRRKPNRFQQDYNRLGRSGFEIYILEENVPPALCAAREGFWISEYKATDPRFGYNKLSERPIPGCFREGLPENLAKKAEG